MDESEEEKEDVVVSSFIPTVQQQEDTVQLPFKRIHSPSSINIYNQCARKYYYQYMLKLETLPSIHLTRGTIAHSTLEDFFKTDVQFVHQDHYEFELKVILMEQFRRHWRNAKDEFEKIGLMQEQLLFYYKETVKMLENWFERFLGKMKKELKTHAFIDAFKRLTPLTETPLLSEKHGVRGIIDAIHQIENEIIIMDYKTSNKSAISEEYKLQLAIYALLYSEKHGILPSKVGIDFLKFDERYLAVDQKLVEFAKKEIAKVHQATRSEEQHDYPRTITPLCKWSTGQCDFYKVCKPHG